MSSFLGAKGASGFNLDLIKSPSSSSVSSSTLSKSSSVSSLSIINKRPRTPRKKPNQSYIEAATLLSTACPKVFSINNLHKKHSTLLSSLSSSSLFSSDIFPPYAVLNESDLLIEAPSHDPNPPYQFKFKYFSTNEKSCIGFQEGSPPKSVDYDVDSIFDEKVAEGIDSIMGKLSMNDCDSTANSNPFVGSSMGFGLGKNIQHALRGAYDEGWWSPMVMVHMKDIFPKFNALASLDKKNAKTKKKKKVEKEAKDESEVFKITRPTNITTSSCKLDGKLKSGLGLKLNHEEVIKAWGDCRFPLSCDSGTLESSAEITARLSKINLSPDNEAGGMREASILRYREKRRTRHFSKKVCYQVRKINADCRPRIKGRFVKRTRSPDEASEEDGD